MNSVVIKSANTSTTLTFSERDGEYFLVAYESKFKIKPTVFKIEIDNGTYLVDLWEK